MRHADAPSSTIRAGLPQRARRISAGVAVSGLALLGGAAAPALGQTVRYRVVELEQSSGSQPTAISNEGHVSGIYFAVGGARRAFLWHDGAATDIGTLGGIAQGLDVNDSGAVVGYSVDAQGRQHAVRYHGGEMAPLTPLQGGIHSSAASINSAGLIAGMSQRRQGNDMLQRAALWQDGQPIDLGTFGGEFSEASGINDSGQVVGWAWNASRRHRAFLWTSGGGMTDLGTLGGLTAGAAGINELGHVVGNSHLADNQSQNAFVWTPEGGMVDLGRPEGATYSAAFSINSAGQIVGDSLIITPECEFIGLGLLWEGGTMLVLSDLIDPAPGWEVAGAAAINDRGEIAATARRFDGPYRSVLLVPVAPCPADIDGDDSVNSTDIAAFLTAWLNSVGGGTLEADITGNGVTDSADISAFLTLWLVAVTDGC